VKSLTTERFRALYGAAPDATKAKIRAAYQLWSENPDHPSLRFKKVHSTQPIYSARVDLDWRALGLMQGDTMIWFWVGPHSEYERLLKKL
jgi:hypothetical protein